MLLSQLDSQVSEWSIALVLLVVFIPKFLNDLYGFIERMKGGTGERYVNRDKWAGQFEFNRDVKSKLQEHEREMKSQREAISEIKTTVTVAAASIEQIKQWTKPK